MVTIGLCQLPYGSVGQGHYTRTTTGNERFLRTERNFFHPPWRYQLSGRAGGRLYQRGVKAVGFYAADSQSAVWTSKAAGGDLMELTPLPDSQSQLTLNRSGREGSGSPDCELGSTEQFDDRQIRTKENSLELSKGSFTAMGVRTQRQMGSAEPPGKNG